MTATSACCRPSQCLSRVPDRKSRGAPFTLGLRPRFRKGSTGTPGTARAARAPLPHGERSPEGRVRGRWLGQFPLTRPPATLSPKGRGGGFLRRRTQPAPNAPPLPHAERSPEGRVRGETAPPRPPSPRLARGRNHRQNDLRRVAGLVVDGVVGRAPCGGSRRAGRSVLGLTSNRG